MGQAVLAGQFRRAFRRYLPEEYMDRRRHLEKNYSDLFGLAQPERSAGRRRDLSSLRVFFEVFQVVDGM